ncbi:hypothetical protein MUK42_02452 [Musa troglodytarum]|uniref:Uncharacterized protein n=1 Tax=Musa troglodytarum TaxID=320322 RepID=A0A9E7K7R4_9LILI|nr:hypothetical protein MUK42_02452 [Musa troglodytarum]
MSVAYGYLPKAQLVSRRKSRRVPRPHAKEGAQAQKRSHARSPAVRGPSPHSTHDCEHDWKGQSRSRCVGSEATTDSPSHPTKSSHTPQEFQWRHK